MRKERGCVGTRGLTLLEAVVAGGILLVALLYILKLYTTGQHVFLKSQFRTVAVKLAQETLEARRTAAVLVDGSETSCPARNGRDYNVVLTIGPAALAPAPSPALPSAAAAEAVLKRLQVVVSGPVTSCGSGQLAPGGVKVEFHTLIARQVIP